MVYLKQIIKSEKEQLLKHQTIEVACYLFISDKDRISEYNFELSGDEDLSINGFLGNKITSIQVEKILNKPKVKGFDYTNNIFKLLGLYLASNEDFKAQLVEKFHKTSIKNQYIIQKVSPEFQKDFSQTLTEKTDNDLLTNILKSILLDSSNDIEFELNSFLNKELDIFDILILEEIERYYIKKSISITKYRNLTSKELIIQVLNEFGNSVKRITQNRRKGHSNFEIKKEYDVQDLLYVMLKGIFPKIKMEEPTPGVGGKYNLIDLIEISEGIMIEVKMIKESDQDERKFIEQLKIDIQSYYKYENLKELIFFIYDPQNKTTDRHKFYELDSEMIINQRKFNVRTIITN